MLSESARGIYIVSITPFNDSGAIDYPSVDTLMDFYIGCGVDGITILGMMGEAQKLTLTEAREFVNAVLKRVAGRVPVVVGVSNSALANVQALTKTAMEAGAAGVLLAPAAGLCTDEQIFEYFARVCTALGPGAPFAYQDYPYSTGVYLSVPLFQRMVQAFPQLVMLKHEDCPGLAKLSRIRTGEAENGFRRVSILTGNGGLYLPLELRRGADGAMTGFAYPEMLVQVWKSFTSGDAEGAEDLFDRYLPLIRYEQQPGFGLAVRKELLRRRGAIATSIVRMPGPSLDKDDLAELDRLVERLNGTS